jgi:ATP-dependent protease HslVU (ClpYQ) peptidase subunit
VTCVIGLLCGNRVIFGADSAGTQPGTLDQARFRTSKSFTNGPYVFGGAGSYRMIQIVEHCFEPPEPDWDKLERFMAHDFADSLRESLKEHGWLEQLDERDSASGGELLVSVGGRLFLAEPDFSILEPEQNYYAIGYGAPYAIGALHATAALDPPIEARERVMIGLRAAQEFNAGVREPFVIEEYDLPKLKLILAPTHVREEKEGAEVTKKVRRGPKKKTDQITA